MLTVDSRDFQKAVSKVVAKAWIDEEFKERLLSTPAAVLEEDGLTLPTGAEVRVNENASLESLSNLDTDLGSNLVYEIPLPPKPATLTSEQVLASASGDESALDSLPGICL